MTDSIFAEHVIIFIHKHNGHTVTCQSNFLIHSRCHYFFPIFCLHVDLTTAWFIIGKMTSNSVCCASVIFPTIILHGKDLTNKLVSRTCKDMFISVNSCFYIVIG